MRPWGCYTDGLPGGSPWPLNPRASLPIPGHAPDYTLNIFDRTEACIITHLLIDLGA